MGRRHRLRNGRQAEPYRRRRARRLHLALLGRQARTFGDSTGALGSVYGTATFDRTYVTASLGYGRFETSTTRVVAIQGSPTERQTAKYGTDAYTGFIELGYKIPVQGVVVTPFANFQPSVLRQGAATETSEMANPLFGLSYGARDTVSLPASLGLQVQRSFALGEWDTTVEARAAWVHEFQPDRGLRASFVSLPGGIFTASGVAASEDLARLSSTITLSPRERPQPLRARRRRRRQQPAQLFRPGRRQVRLVAAARPARAGRSPRFMKSAGWPGAGRRENPRGILPRRITESPAG